MYAIACSAVLETFDTAPDASEIIELYRARLLDILDRTTWSVPNGRIVHDVAPGPTPRVKASERRALELRVIELLRRGVTQGDEDRWPDTVIAYDYGVKPSEADRKD